MASYPGLGSTGQEYILEEQYKALFGYPNGKVNLSLDQEVPGTSRPFILQNQIYSQEIPITAPSDNELSAEGTTSIGGIGGATANYRTATDHPYLTKYYDVPLGITNTYNQTVGALTWWFLASSKTTVYPYDHHFQ